MIVRRLAGLAMMIAAAFPGCILGGFEESILGGVVLDAAGHPLAGSSIRISGVPAALEIETRSDAQGRFELRAPYGEYRLTAGGVECRMRLEPFASVVVQIAGSACRLSDETPPLSAWPETFGADGLLVGMEPSAVTQPLNLTGLTTAPAALISLRGFSWTETRVTFEGLNATDAYQPGVPALLADTSVLETVTVRNADGPEVVLTPQALTGEWHFRLATSDTSGWLASSNLAAPVGAVEQSEYYNRFTRDHFDAGGPVGQHLALFVSQTGQWANQTVPFESPGSNLGSRLLLTNARAVYQARGSDRLETVFSGAGSHLSNWGTPVGIETLMAIRGGAELESSPNGGYPNTPEHDRFADVSAAWIRSVWGGELRVGFGLSSSRLATSPGGAVGNPSAVSILGGVTNNIAPLDSIGNRTRVRLSADYEAAARRLGSTRHVMAAGAAEDHATIGNQFSAPGNENLIETPGAGAYYELMLNTPAESRESINGLQGYWRDRVRLTSWLSASAAVIVEGARGSVTGQPGPAISWANISPRVGFSAMPGSFRRLTLTGSYGRFYEPLAGRYLDFADPHSLGGIEYRASGSQEILTFGGPYSSVDPRLKRPYAGEFDVGAHATLPGGIAARLDLFRRTEKARIAALDTGIPAGDFTPVSVLDQGPLTVYAQWPDSFGMDHYTLTNPAGLRQLDEGLIASLETDRRGWHAGAALMALKSYGPTNPGNSPYENDPGVIGALYVDPNASINAQGRAYFDRAYVGKVRLARRLPKWLGGLEWANTVTYMDGLPFARLLLVNGLPQGPILVQASVHGSPGGGNRAEHVLNWNMRLARGLPVGRYRARAGADVLNAANANDRMQEIDIASATFNSRLPEAIQPARYARLFVEFEF